MQFTIPNQNYMIFSRYMKPQNLFCLVFYTIPNNFEQVKLSQPSIVKDTNAKNQVIKHKFIKLSYISLTRRRHGRYDCRSESSKIADVR